jgi:phosphoribosylpyrophosphate synthetase
MHDRIAANYILADDFNVNSNNIGIEDIQVTNTYEIKGEKNPHKSYGYLRTPEMANLIYQFLTRDRSKISIWFLQRIKDILNPGRIKTELLRKFYESR